MQYYYSALHNTLCSKFIVSILSGQSNKSSYMSLIKAVITMILPLALAKADVVQVTR